MNDTKADSCAIARMVVKSRGRIWGGQFPPAIVDLARNYIELTNDIERIKSRIRKKSKKASKGVEASKELLNALSFLIGDKP